MHDVGYELAADGRYTLRTGGAPGGDQAFLAGALTAGTHGGVQVYAPWVTFEQQALRNRDTGRTLGTFNPEAPRTMPANGRWIMGWPTDAAYLIAAECHPAWPPLKGSVRKLLARDVHQVLGWDVQAHRNEYDLTVTAATPVAFIVCWTPDGSLTGDGPDSGGTGMALRVAARYAVNVPVFNLARDEHCRRITERLTQLRQEREAGEQLSISDTRQGTVA
jgi:hypothetical protein